mmetsp:Transcript_31254/g.71360  ORF Transcript_31254/g.71360 Transcript_31254/m.71360 type:complete len:414 (+) Transcript_31254:126-1367(+)
MPPRKATPSLPLDWANQRVAKIEAAKKLREDRKDHLTEEHTFCPRRMARRAASNGRLPQGLPRIPASPPDEGAANPKQGPQKDAVAKSGSSANRTFSPVDDATRRKHSKPPTPRGRLYADEQQSPVDKLTSVPKHVNTPQSVNEKEPLQRRKSTSDAVPALEAVQSFQASPRPVEGGPSIRRSPPQQALHGDRRPIDVEVAMEGPTNLVVSSTFVYESKATEVAAGPQHNEAVKDEPPPPPTPLPESSTTMAPRSSAEPTGVEQSLPADSKLWCMDLEATWQCGLDAFGADDAALVQNSNVPQMQASDHTRSEAMDTIDGWELASPSDRSAGGQEMSRPMHADVHTSARLNDMSSDGTGSPSLAAHGTAAESAQACSEGGTEAPQVEHASTLFEGSSSHDSWSVVPMPAALVG